MKSLAVASSRCWSQSPRAPVRHFLRELHYNLLHRKNWEKWGEWGGANGANLLTASNLGNCLTRSHSLQDAGLAEAKVARLMPQV